jgi:hypothetical protein
MEYVLFGLVLGKSVFDWWAKRKLQTQLNVLSASSAAAIKHWEDKLREHGLAPGGKSLGGGKSGGD